MNYFDANKQQNFKLNVNSSLSNFDSMLRKLNIKNKTLKFCFSDTYKLKKEVTIH